MEKGLGAETQEAVTLLFLHPFPCSQQESTQNVCKTKHTKEKAPELEQWIILPAELFTAAGSECSHSNRPTMRDVHSVN